MMRRSQCMTPAASPDEKFQGIVEGIRAHLVEEYGRDETGRPTSMPGRGPSARQRFRSAQRRRSIRSW
jgi:hypothetical protein